MSNFQESSDRLNTPSSSNSPTNLSSNLSINSSTVNRLHGWMPPNLQLNSSDNARLLKLVLFSGHNLAKKDIFGASDPYVRIDLLKSDRTVIDSVYTKTKKKTLNPLWNEEFLFRVNPSSHWILIEVFDENRLTRDDFLGRVELSLADVKIAHEGDDAVPTSFVLQQRSLKSKVRGYLEIYIALLENNENHTDDQNLIGDGEWEIVQSSNSTSKLSNSTPNEDLPLGWEELQDTNGRTYFVNHNKRTTQWERPLCSKSNSSVQTSENVSKQILSNFDLSQNYNISGESEGSSFDSSISQVDSQREDNLQSNAELSTNQNVHDQVDSSSVSFSSN